MFPSSLKTQPADLCCGFLFAHQSASEECRQVYCSLGGKLACVEELACTTWPQMAARGDTAILFGLATYFDGSEEIEELL